jgi:hypothetical protein
MKRAIIASAWLGVIVSAGCGGCGCPASAKTEAATQAAATDKVTLIVLFLLGFAIVPCGNFILHIMIDGLLRHFNTYRSSDRRARA